MSFCASLLMFFCSAGRFCAAQHRLMPRCSVAIPVAIFCVLIRHGSTLSAATLFWDGLMMRSIRLGQPARGRTGSAPTREAAMAVGQAIEQCGRHLGVREDARPFTKGEVGGDDDRGALVEAADEVEQELAAGLGEGQIAEFIEDDEVHAGEMIGEPPLPSVASLGL